MNDNALNQQYQLLLKRDWLTMELPMKIKGKVKPYKLTPEGARKALEDNLGVKLIWVARGGGKKFDFIAAKGGEPSGVGTWCRNVFANSDPENLKPQDKLIFEVPSEYEVESHTGRAWGLSSPADILVLRSMIWHELMEHAFIYLELFHPAFDEIHNLREYVGHGFNRNPIHWRIHDRQADLVTHLKFYHWTIEPPDPPGCPGEREAWQHEGNARDAQHWAEHYEGLVWRTAAEKWEEARKYWNLAADAWRLIAGGESLRAGKSSKFAEGWFHCHPDWKTNAERCEDNAEAAKERRDAALQETQQGATKPAPSWNVAGSGGGKITIHYSDWPHGFRAKILDYKERKVTEVSGTPGSKEGKVEWGKDAAPGTYYVEVNVANERSEKVIIKKPLAWQAKVKFGSNGPYVSLTPKIGTNWPKGKGFGFSIHNSSGSTNKIGFVNVQDSNRTVEVTWGRESNQRFGDWGKHIIWAYAHDPGLQAMFNNLNLCPNWRTDVEIPVPSFKVNGAKASVAVAAKGPLIAPDTEQSLSIEYDNWPGKIEGIRQVSIALFRVRSSIRMMKKMRLSFSLLAIGLVLTGLLSCTGKQKSTQLTAEPRWLRIYHDGEFKWKIDVSGWEVGEDVIDLGFFYYPWQGEDSINWTEYDPYYGHPYWTGPYLVVNDKVVGVNLGFIPLDSLESEDPEKIITAAFDEYLMGSDFDPAVLEKFPNLIGLSWCVGASEDLERIETIPSNLRIYLFCYGEITGADLKGLSKFSNIRSLRIEDGSLSYRDLRYLCRFKELRWFEFITRVHQEERIRCLRKLEKMRYWYVGPIII